MKARVYRRDIRGGSEELPDIVGTVVPGDPALGIRLSDVTFEWEDNDIEDPDLPDDEVGAEVFIPMHIITRIAYLKDPVKS